MCKWETCQFQIKQKFYLLLKFAYLLTSSKAILRFSFQFHSIFREISLTFVNRKNSFACEYFSLRLFFSSKNDFIVKLFVGHVNIISRNKLLFYCVNSQMLETNEMEKKVATFWWFLIKLTEMQLAESANIFFG